MLALYRAWYMVQTDKCARRIDVLEASWGVRLSRGPEDVLTRTARWGDRSVNTLCKGRWK